MTILTTLEAIVAAAPETAIELENGERFISVPTGIQVAVRELSGLKGVQFNDSYGQRFELQKVNSVLTEIYENGDGRFLALRLRAQFIYGESEIEERLTIWVPEEAGEPIEATFEVGEGHGTYIDGDSLAPALNRFSLI